VRWLAIDASVHVEEIDGKTLTTPPSPLYQHVQHRLGDRERCGGASPMRRDRLNTASHRRSARH